MVATEIVVSLKIKLLHETKIAPIMQIFGSWETWEEEKLKYVMINWRDFDILLADGKLKKRCGGWWLQKLI